jgi:predicted phage-related endonuclease
MSILLSGSETAEEAKRQVWLEQRAKVVTSTDIPVLFGQGYEGSSPANLYAKKKGLAPDWQPSLRMTIGRLIEPVIHQVYTLKTGRKVVAADSYKLHVSAEYPFLGCSLDAQDDEGVILETKNHGDYMRDETDIPAGWYLQMQTQMIVMKVDLIRLVVLTRGSDLAVFEIAANLEVQAEIVARAKAFYDLLQASTPPAPTVPEDNDAYKYIFQARVGESVDLGEGFEDLGAEREAVTRQIKELEEVRDLLEARVKYAMGEATVAVLPDTGEIWTWNPDKNGRRRLIFKKRKQ